MVKGILKKAINKILGPVGYDLVKTAKNKSLIESLSGLPSGKMDTLLEFLKQKGFNCQIIMDVGANNTSWSRMAQGVFPHAKFYLIEPQHEMLPHLEAFCSEFQDSSYFLSGASSKCEILTLTVWDDLAGSSFLPVKDKELKALGKQREIEMITIDSLLNNSKAQIPDLVKLDIQGFELQALEGAKKLFGYTEVFIIEVSLFSFSDVPGQPIFSEVIAFMHERGYEVYDFAGFLRRPMDNALGQCDICFVKSDGFLRRSRKWK